MSVVLLLGVNSVTAQDDSTVVFKQANGMGEYRPVGEVRLWTFVSKNETIGHMVSTVTGTDEIDGRQAYVINEELKINYDQDRAKIAVTITGDNYVSDKGYYLGDHLDVALNNPSEKFQMERDGDKLKGYFTREDNKVKREFDLDENIYSWESYLVDRLELFLARQNFKVGDTIRAKIYQPLSMVETEIFGTVHEFSYREIYQNKYDSVFHIHITKPQDYHLLITPDKRLLRADFPSHRIRAYLDLVRMQAKPKEPELPKLSLNNLVDYLPSWILYLFIMTLTLLFLAFRGFKRFNAYLGLFLGAVFFIAIPYTQIPIQEWVIKSVVTEKIQAGGSLYLWGVFPALVTGIIQEILKLVLIYLLFFWRNPSQRYYMTYGAFIGAGFGFIESCYLAQPLGLILAFSLPLLERGFLVIYHIVSGLMLGRAVGNSRNQIIVTLIFLIIVNSLLRYLPILVQQKALPVYLVYFIMAFTIMIVTTLAVMLMKKSNKVIGEVSGH